MGKDTTKNVKNGGGTRLSKPTPPKPTSGTGTTNNSTNN